jgi:response regulator RpfG family c-di-GMP phosphodiesterase
MPAWVLPIATGTAAWTLVAAGVLTALARLGKGVGDEEAAPPVLEPASVPEPAPAALAQPLGEPLHILVVDDDPNLRALLRTSFEVAGIEVEEADSSSSAAQKIGERHPSAIVLDVGMPGVNGLDFCRSLKRDPFTREIPVVLLTGDAVSESSARQVGADAFLRKPFSPLALLTIVERLGAAERQETDAISAGAHDEKQLLLYAQDFRRLLELERGQRALLNNAYRETVVALARALESKDGATGAHSDRVRRYATELAAAVDYSLLDEPSLEYGFILHDIGKIAIPDSVLAKPAPLTDSERRLLETHTVLGEQMVGHAALLRGHGARVVRSHHERWDGRGYPDRLARDEIPLCARVFSVGDALDAMTSNRPYRRARPWEDAVAEITAQAGTQFDPDVVTAFRDREEALRRIYDEFNVN